MFLTLAVLRRNHRFSNAFQQDYLADPRNCPLQQPGQLKDELEPEQLDLPAFFKQVPAWKSGAGHPAWLPPKHPQQALPGMLHTSEASPAKLCWQVCSSELCLRPAGVSLAGGLRHCFSASGDRLPAALQAPAAPHDEGHHCITGGPDAVMYSLVSARASATRLLAQSLSRRYHPGALLVAQPSSQR